VVGCGGVWCGGVWWGGWAWCVCGVWANVVCVLCSLLDVPLSFCTTFPCLSKVTVSTFRLLFVYEQETLLENWLPWLPTSWTQGGSASSQELSSLSKAVVGEGSVDVDVHLVFVLYETGRPRGVKCLKTQDSLPNAARHRRRVKDVEGYRNTPSNKRY